MHEYDPKQIEAKWQKEWENSGIYKAENKKLFGNKPKYYALIEFPYPSGDGLHVGHPRPYIAIDIVARKRRMQGYNVLYPIGWDAFGLPTENYAIKTGRPPAEITKENSDNFRKQIQSLGISFDWSREVNTTDPKYYKWTQWLFLKFLEHGLAYKAKAEINWCPKDKIGLANEEVIDGKCERCGTEVEKREKEQWMLAITKYAKRLYDDVDKLDFPDRVKAQQKHWIGPVYENGDEANGKIIGYHLRDWVFSRQRYWGEPIPVVHCERCGIVPVPEKELPVTLPEVENYQPTDTGESPLANITDWVNTTCPKCSGAAKRETDTMPNWAGSSWYFLRYADPHNDKEFASKKALKYWTPVDWYNGGMEHTTLHLLYSRFWHKFFYDIGLVPTDEPYKKRTSHGMILAEGGEKMSKSKGNVVSPDTIVNQFGADTLRVYEMFMGPFEQAIAWNENALVGPRRFLERVWGLREKMKKGAQPEEYLMHKTIKKISEDIETLGFNTSVSSLMVWVNDLEKRENISEVEYRNLILLLAPFAPHITEEIWTFLGEKGSVHQASWPKYDEKKLELEKFVYAIQVNGKVRGSMKMGRDITEEEALKKAKETTGVAKWLEGGEVRKVIIVKGKIVNIVVS